MSNSDEIYILCKVPNKKGLHARAAAQIVSVSSGFDSELTITHKNKTVISLSLVKLLTLDAPQGSSLEIRATGPQAEIAADAIREIIENGFGE